MTEQVAVDSADQPNGTSRTGAWLLRYALEQLPVSHSFGIPGVHNTELYDELARSERIHPVLVTHELGAACIADAISRTRPREIGLLVIVPAAGITHALSGICESFLAGIPVLVICGGIRTDLPYRYQIHEIDQHSMLKTVTKGTWKAERHDQIIPFVFDAYCTAISGTPGPVVVEVPVNVQLFKGPVGKLPQLTLPDPPSLDQDTFAEIQRAADLLAASQRPGLFVGWGAVDATDHSVNIAEMLGAPVSTTLQGLSAFPSDHPLHTGMGFGPAAVPAATRAFRDCDCLLAVGTRFAEIPTGSFSSPIPEQLIHVDIDASVIGTNYPASVGLVGDSRLILEALARALRERQVGNPERHQRVADQIAANKRDYHAEWLGHQTDRVNPAVFFEALRERLEDDAIVAVDDGNHTFLAAELFSVRSPRSFLSPTDFNAMGYCVPACVGAAIVNPDRQVIGVVGDGAFLMTGMELLTASSQNATPVVFVFNDGELSQIAQGQEIPYNRKTCTVLGSVRLEGMAQASGAAFHRIENNQQIADGIDAALADADAGSAVVIDVHIDYSKRTRFTQGVVKTVLKRFPTRDKLRFVGRAVGRKIKDRFTR